MKHFVYFIGWMLKRMFSGVGCVYQSYDKMITTDPLLAFLPTFFIGIMTFVLSVVVAYIAKVPVDIWVIFMWVSEPLIFLNYIRILLREQYRKYLREQDKFVDTLKGEQ